MILITWSVPDLGRGAEFLWLLERYRRCADPRLKPTWLALVVRVFNPTDQAQLETILTESRQDVEVAAAVSPLIDPIDIASAQAQCLRKAYESHQQLEHEMRAVRDRPMVSPPPAERVAIWLQRFEGGELTAWVRLLRELTLEPHSTQYEVFEEDIVDLAGWKAASTVTRERLLSAARAYVLQADPETERWLGQNLWNRRAVAGARALQLLQREQPDSLHGFDDSVWGGWAASLLVFPAFGNGDHLPANRELVRLAYDRASDEVIRSVLVLIDAANDKAEHLTVVDLLEECWDAQLAEALHAKCQEGSLNPQILITLISALLEHGHTASHTLAISLVPTQVPTDGTARELAIGTATVLLRFAPQAGWPTVWGAFQGDREFGKVVIAQIDWHGSLVTSLLGEDQLADLYLWVAESYPQVEEEAVVTRMGWLDYASGWCNGILQALESRGTDKGCQAILRLMRERPEQTPLKWSLQSAREATRMRSWKPVEPEYVLQMTRDSRKRLVRSGNDLLCVIIESLGNFAHKLRGEAPLVSNLWNEVAPGVWKPKDEDHFSDNVKQHLDDDLRSKGVVLNREVQIRRNRGSTKGERTDIHVDAAIPRLPEDMDVITVIIEVKGCWNKELWTSMEAQLAGRYLHETHAHHGLYLVGWFNCTQWDSYDNRKPPTITLAKAQERLDEQARKLSLGHVCIKAVVLDTSLR